VERPQPGYDTLIEGQPNQPEPNKPGSQANSR
jgi:hypothetical protein